MRRKHRSEFEVQSDMYQALKGAGYDVDGEIPLELDGRSCGRMDLLLYVDDEPRLIIEVKADRIKADSLASKVQCDTYERRSGLPVLLVCDEDVPHIVELVWRCLQGWHQNRGTDSALGPKSAKSASQLANWATQQLEKENPKQIQPVKPTTERPYSEKKVTDHLINYLISMR